MPWYRHGRQSQSPRAITKPTARCPLVENTPRRGPWDFDSFLSGPEERLSDWCVPSAWGPGHSPLHVLLLALCAIEVVEE
ncbi:hypothetical protein chiPu_0020703 [Chiloscyllium punctatum]|uniref:Uncharacterized protein n=1 Tax=Chiloscyllium punctatum TaxID=137246 RepID=A0A401RIP9_CHIPU|nr:hypothetical protein [Chiloscyllium punctatum]